LQDRHLAQITQLQKSNALKNSSSFIDPTFACFQTVQSASAREYRAQCEDRLKTTQYGTPVYNGGAGWDYSGVTYGSEVVNRCTGETAIGVVTGFGNGGTSIGLTAMRRTNSFLNVRTSALWKDKAVDVAAAVTAGIDLGRADIFLGGGYNYSFATNSTANSYPFFTTGVDFRLTPQIDLNGSFRIPVGGGSGNNTNYLVGASWNF
jgi:hypothetical protein